MLFFVVNTLQTALDYREKSTKIEAERQEIDRLKKEQNFLKKTLEKVKSAAFVEEEARNKLNMCLPGETVVVGQ